MSKTFQITLPQIHWKKLFGLRPFFIGCGLLVVFLGTHWWREVRPFFPLERSTLQMKMVEMKAETAIRLDEKLFEEGARFQRGETLLPLKETKAEFEACKVKLAQEKNKFEQTMERYVQVQVTTPQDVDRVLLEVQSAQQKIDQIEKELQVLGSKTKDAASFQAPFDGVVMKRLKQPGDCVLPGEAVLLLCDVRSRWVETAIPETLLSKVHLGTVARIQFPSFPDDVWEGQISWISPFVKEGKIQIRLSAEALPQQAGLSANVSLRIRE
jgi:biotin carboxyl carrier protein